MSAVHLILGVALIVGVLWETFETIVLPRRVTRRLRLTRLFYRSTWLPWSRIARAIRVRKRREAFLSVYGPLSLVVLLAVWAAGLIVGFALLHYSLSTPLRPALNFDFQTDLYFSGTTFFTLGLGDITPASRFGRLLAIVESGLGFGFLAVVIGYLPVLNQSFSRREVIISMLDARSGSPPTAAEIVRRHVQDYGWESLSVLFRDWEQWAAELMESHLSYPVLAYFRSQHDNQSWLAAMTAVLDASALVMAAGEGTAVAQARLSFAMARHAVVDLSQVFATAPRYDGDRFDGADFARITAPLANQRDGFDVAAARQRLSKLRPMYEPYVRALSEHLMMPLPPWGPKTAARDNWQTSAWQKDEVAD